MTVESGDLRRRALHGVKWSVVKTWYAQASSLLVLLIMARLLSPADFGLFAIGHMIVTLLTAVANQGLGQALVQRDKVEPSHFDTVFWANCGIGLFLAILLVIAARSISDLFGEPALVSILPTLALVQFLNNLGSVANAILIRRLDFRSSSIITIVCSTIGGSVAVVMGYRGYGVWSLVGQHLSGAVIGLILTSVFARWLPKMRFSLHHLKQVWSFGALAMLGNLLGQLNGRIGVVLIGAFIGTQAVGLFSVGRRVVRMGSESIAATVGRVAMPAFANIQKDKPRLKIAYLNAVQSVSAIACPIFATLAVFSNEITVLALGSTWRDGAPVLCFLALGAILAAPTGMTGSVLLAGGRADLRLLLGSANLIITVALFLLVYPYGLQAVAAAFAFRMLFVIPIGVVLVGKVIPVSVLEYLRAIAPILVATAIGIACAGTVRWQSFLPTNDLTVLMFGGTVGGIIYWIALGILADGTRHRLIDYGKVLLNR